MEEEVPGLQQRLVEAGLAGRGEMCQQDLAGLAEWVLPWQLGDHKLLMDSGRAEQANNLLEVARYVYTLIFSSFEVHFCVIFRNLTN